ncbi:DUF3644 domain-containing protein [Candidatus Saccharibacteria bacterium]|nr:DUF3644 domain-containing protein [Candidatus Saccharibacteria bacterium]
MSARLSRNAKDLLDKAMDSATQAITTYNDPRSSFRTGNFTILMSIAWTSLIHAYFEQSKVNYFYKEENGRYTRIDGDKKAWDLARSVSEVFDKESPIRSNLELFVKLRNKIEHRNLPALDKELIGESQALVLNFEDWMTEKFGDQYTLIYTMFVPIQLTRSIKRILPISKDEEAAVKFVKDYRGLLHADIDNSQQYSFKAYLVPKIGNHRSSSDVAIEFVKYDQSNPEEMKKYDKAIVAIKEKHIPVVNEDHIKPHAVLERLASAGHVRNMSWHTSMWRKYKVRPSSNARDKTACKTDYCKFDRPHQDYLYTEAWVNLLLEKELGN